MQKKRYKGFYVPVPCKKSFTKYYNSSGLTEIQLKYGKIVCLKDALRYPQYQTNFQNKNA